MKISGGPYGKALKNYLSHVEFEKPETQLKFHQVINQDGNPLIDESEAKEALTYLDLFNRPNLTVLSDSEVEQIAAALNTMEKSINRFEALGTVYKIPGTEFTAVMLKKDSVEKELGESLEKFFADCPTHQSYQVKNGYIVNIDWYQQLALLEAISEKIPKLKIGLFNYRAAENVAKVLKESDAHKKFQISWFWTGEPFKKSLGEDKQMLDEPNLIFEDRLNEFDAPSFFNYDFVEGKAYSIDYDGHNSLGGIVFGFKR